MTIAGELGQVGASITLRRRATQRLAVFASLILVLLAVVAALVMVQGIDRQLRDVVHTYDVRNQARELTIALSEAESGQRGFVLTRDTSYLDPYRAAISSIRTRVLSLLAITEDDAAQSDIIESLAGDIDIKIAEMDRTVELVQSQRAGEARTLIQTGLGEQVMGTVRDTLELFISEENAKLLARNRSIDDWRRWLVGAIVVALAAAVLLSYALLSRSRREVRALAVTQNLLASENEELEAHIRERTQAVEEARAHAERERQRVEALLQDTNHRIGNSLATVSSLLGLQLLRSRSDEVKQALEAARSRVHAIASAHRRLRLGDDLETATASDFLEAVIEDIETTNSGNKAVSITSEIEPITVSARDATTIGILVGELVTNALKHGFPGGRVGTIKVALKRNADGMPVLTVADDGVGITESEVSESGLGSVIVKQLSRQFDGVPSYSGNSGQGLTVTVPLPGIDASAKATSS